MASQVSCSICGVTYDPLRARAVAIIDGGVRAFCSLDCQNRARNAKELARQAELASSSRRRRRIVAGVALTLVLTGGATTAAVGPLFERKLVETIGQPAVARDREQTMVVASHLVASARRDLMESARLSLDVWMHPLFGPDRVLPLRGPRRFGAPREGSRPEECGEGHCGVDLGTHRGDAVAAVHDGLVERVVTDDQGKEGRFVRLSHKDGTVVSYYMHLDRIRADLRAGMSIRAGEVIGTIGETGVQHSGPHLHFAVAVREHALSPETFIDPEPLLHLWRVQAPKEIDAKLFPKLDSHAPVLADNGSSD